MNTAFLLMAQYEARAIIPVEMVARDYFPHLTVPNFLRKLAIAEIKIPLVRMDPDSQKSAKGVHLNDLVQYIDARRAAAAKELAQMAHGLPG